ncbi:MAG: CARDB domain-containing protein [Candidatus Pacebacteria bacterium]|nr:CARDB domain-containing protein [Candidatus Paceibacterota bacterium]
MRKKLFAPVIFLLALAVFVTASPALAVTADEIRAQITALQDQIAQLMVQLNQLQGNSGATWCHTFNTNLGIGSSGNEVDALHTALAKSGFGNDDWSHSNFDEPTASLVVGFQEKYRNEVLNAYGLTHGTGYVGKSTRAKLNALYGCGSQGQPSQTACAEDAKICPDGSAVSRVWPSCQFAACPASTATSSPVCTDSDGGLDFYVKGYTTENNKTSWDVCAGSLDAPNTLWEKACNGSIFYDCPNGCSDGACLASSSPAQKSITVLSPNGGETLYFGNTYTIKWTSQGVEKAVVYLWFSDGGTCLLGSVPASQGSYTFKPEENKGCPNIAKGLTSGQYKVYIVTEDADLGVGGAGAQDSSDNFFSIVSPAQKSITVLSPNGGEKWQLDQDNHEVAWSTHGSWSAKEVVTVYLRFPDGLACALAGASASAGKMTFELKQGGFCLTQDNTAKYYLPGDSYRIMVMSNDKVYADLSDNYFSILPAAIPAVAPTDSDNSPDYTNNPISLPVTQQNYPDLFIAGVGKGIYIGGSLSKQYIFGQEPNPSTPIPTSENFSTFYDYCIGSQLNEAYVTSGGKFGAYGLVCPNGCSEGTCLSAPALPDLVIKNFVWKDYGADGKSFDITIQNIGSVDATLPSDFTIGVYKDTLSSASFVGSAKISGLVGGIGDMAPKTISPSLPIQFSTVLIRNNSFVNATKFIAYVDPANLVEESNESNNTLIK